MKSEKYLTDEELNFIESDCLEAIRAFPENIFQVQRYAKEIIRCRNEKERRERIRMDRNAVKWLMKDELILGQGFGRHPSDYRRSWSIRGHREADHFKTACFNVGWYKLNINKLIPKQAD